MSGFERNLRQTLTYWAPLGTDMYGRTSFAAPVTRICRWEDKSELVRSKKGDEIVTKSRVFMAEDFDINGYVFLGTSVATDPHDVEGAWEIQQRAATPDLRLMKTLYVAYL